MTTFAKIEDALADKVAPSIAMHGGHIQLLSYDEDTKNVHVKLTGSCAGCAASTFTLKLGVEDMLINEFPDDVFSVSHEEGEVTSPYYS
jgi:Fe-S cluster biogenesis protein NfuA|tara:strand:+ start:13511 stop:13777 length:267 start_codon:yes stop_codon:yes gene_type:complete